MSVFNFGYLLFFSVLLPILLVIKMLKIKVFSIWNRIVFVSLYLFIFDQSKAIPIWKKKQIDWYCLEEFTQHVQFHTDCKMKMITIRNRVNIAKGSNQKKCGRSDLARTPPPTVVWTFWHKKFEITKSISDQSKSEIFLIGLG